MNKIIVFSGTTEGRTISEQLSANGVKHMVCVATDFGEQMMDETPYADIHTGRLDIDEMKTLFASESAETIVDATHPYAVVVTANVKQAAEEMGLTYIRVSRACSKSAAKACYFEDAAECAKALSGTTGNILLTTGSKELHIFCEEDSVRERVYARVLPSEESIALCKKAGVDDRHIIAMFGPFSKEINEALIRQFDIKTLVTKESGVTGGFLEKIEAAEALGCDLFIIGRPADENGKNVTEVVAELIKKDAAEGKVCTETCHVQTSHIKISLVGIGMGDEASLTVGARDAIYEADVIFGASRMVDPYRSLPGKEIKELYLARDIIPCLDELIKLASCDKKICEKKTCNKKVAVLFSGDSGLYSGTRKLYDAIMDWKERVESTGTQASEEKDTFSGSCKVDVAVLPGISSVSYFASKMAEAYSDAAIESWHGKASDESYPGSLVATIRENEKTFVYLSGAEDVRKLVALLTSYGLMNCKVTVGYQLSYENEKLISFAVEECPDLSQMEEGLYIAFIKNDNPCANIGHMILDEEFMREKVPMTKADIRHLSVTKLELHKNAVLYDIGAGTGSVSIEAAKQHDSIRVFAFEKKHEAAELIRKNASAFGCGNLVVQEGMAPECFLDYPAPTHAFIGGSSGNMDQIIEELLKKNPKVRIVMNAITIETVGQMADLLKKYGGTDAELIQVSVAKNKQAGNYTLMEAQNPVYIASFTGQE